jgi:hypothetical protein
MAIEGLKIKSGGKSFFFLPTGDVAEDGTEKVVGKWRSESKGNEVRNRLRYDLNGVEQTALPVKYDFNEFNQLVAVIPGAGEGGADGDPYALRGLIRINDNHDVVYEVYAKDGTRANNRVTVYGDIAFAEKTNDLVLTLTGGGDITIKGSKGANGISLMQAEKNFIAEFKADDLLRFVAFTSNDFSTSPARVAKKAQIEFVGKWDMREAEGENQLVFVSKVVSSGGQNTVTLGFAGKVQAVTFGFAYYADKDGHNFAFNIKGEHKWNSTEAKWELSLGYSAKMFKAEFSGSITRKGKYGQFALTGAAKIEHESGKKATMSLQVEGVYTFENNKLVFKVDIQTSGGKLTYDLLLEGKFVFKGGTLSFQVKFSNKNPSQDLSINITFKSDGDQLKTDLSIVLEKSKNDIKLTFEFELRLRWKDGVLIKDPPKPLAA